MAFMVVKIGARDECCLGRQKCKQKCKQKATTCIIAHKSLQVVAIDLFTSLCCKNSPILKLGLYILNTFFSLYTNSLDECKFFTNDLIRTTYINGI